MRGWHGIKGRGRDESVEIGWEPYGPSARGGRGVGERQRVTSEVRENERLGIARTKGLRKQVVERGERLTEGQGREGVERGKGRANGEGANGGKQGGRKG